MSEYYRISPSTKIEVEDYALTKDEWNWLTRKVAGGTGTSFKDADANNMHEVTKLPIDIEKLAEIAFEYDILEDVANTVEIEVIRHFRNSTETTMTTGEISDEIGRAKSSVSRALGRLVEKGQLERVQKGVYRSAR